MKKRRNAAHKPSARSSSNGDVHLRLCHVCLNLNESHLAITACTRCGTIYPTEMVRVGRRAEDTADEMAPGEGDDAWDGENRRRPSHVTGLSVVW